MDIKKADMKKAKKSQIMGQVFVFILAGAIFILILTYGYKAISGFTQRSEEVALLEFRTSLETAVGSIRQDYGSVKKFELTLPSNYYEICFVDLDKSPSSEFEQEHPRMYDAWQSRTQNVFLTPMEDSPIDIGKIDLGPTGYACFDVRSGKLDLKLEGLGDKTRISAWTQN